MPASSINFLLNQMRYYQGTLAGGTITFYASGTTTLAPIYLDRNMTQQAANPFMLSADGTAELFGDVSIIYRAVVKNQAGVIVYDFDNLQFGAVSGGTTPGPPGSSSILYSVYTLTTAAVSITLPTTPPDQYVMRNGDNANELIVSPPAGMTFKGGMLTRSLYADGEIMHFLLQGALVYVVA